MNEVKMSFYLGIILTILTSCSNNPAQELMEAINSRNLTETEKLINSGVVDINQLLPNKEYPIITAIKQNNYAITKSLINMGANIEAYGDTIPLFYAISLDDMRIFNLLVDNKADVKAVDSKSQNLLFHCTDSELAKELIQKGLNVNQQDSIGDTPLLAAIKKGNKAVSKALIEHNKTSIYLKNSNNKSPMEIAKEQGFDDILVMLKKADDYKRWPKKGDIVYFPHVNSKHKMGWIVKGQYIGKSSSGKYKIKSLETGCTYNTRPTYKGDIVYERKEYLFRTRASGNNWMKRMGIVHKRG